jgi:hypothetical protein
MDALGLGQSLAELREKVTSALATAQRGRLLSTGLQVLFYVCASLNNHHRLDNFLAQLCLSQRDTGQT